MLYYVEMGVQFTNTYGDINESFYSSMETMYEHAARLIAANGLRDEFETRCKEIVDDTRNIGWGFHDALSDSFAEHFA